ncbi:hypothetical protein BDN67DRAFT_983814 [Paxillus ammoniavirescens]|nr:hypothetical protein BDN67DRAFT_983814 [Paxillus ammoniavirescens]
MSALPAKALLASMMDCKALINCTRDTGTRASESSGSPKVDEFWGHGNISGTSLRSWGGTLQSTPSIARAPESSPHEPKACTKVEQRAKQESGPERNCNKTLAAHAFTADTPLPGGQELFLRNLVLMFTDVSIWDNAQPHLLSVCNACLSCEGTVPLKTRVDPKELLANSD